MSRLMTVLNGTMIVLLAANAVSADTFQTGNWYFGLSNWDNGGGGYGLGPSFNLPTGPTATTDGAVWVKTGSTYALNTADVNIELDFRPAAGQPSVLITNTVLMSTGVAHRDVVLNDSGYCYPGYFNNEYNGVGATRDAGAPYLVAQSTNNFYWLPTALEADPTNFQFDLYFWRGNETSFNAAAAAGEDVANTGWFKAGLMTIDIEFPHDSTFKYMPSAVLQPTLPGDANLDGKVDINDLSKVLTDYDKTGMRWSDGDFNGDGKVDINDLSIVLTNYDKTAGGLSAAVAAVPEPSAVALLAIGLACAFACRWPKRK